MNTSQKGFIVPILIAVVAILVIVGGFYMYRQSKPQLSNVDILEGVYYRADYDYTTNLDGSSQTEHLVFVSPEGKRYAVPDAVAVKFDGPMKFKITGERGGEVMSGSIAIQNPQDQNKIVLMTRISDCLPSGTSQKCILIYRVYNYDLISSDLTNLYVGNPSNALIDEEFQLVATQSSKIILRSHTIGTSSICGGNWLKGVKYYSFDLDNVSNGYQTFQVPDSLIQRDQAAEAACEAKL